MKLKQIIVILTLSQVMSFCIAQTPVQITQKDIDRAKSLVSQMTLDEKISFIAKDLSIGPVPRLGIPQIEMHDGPQGMGNEIRGICFPCGVLTAATWDRNMALKIGEGLGTDFKDHQTDVILGPGVNIYRGPLCGRNFEYFGEDPYLASEVAKQYILGVQSKGVIATIKHFCANNVEHYRNLVNAIVDLRTLHEIYLSTFRKAVTEAHVGAIMDSYNMVNGVFSTENRYQNIEVLRKKWGYKGFVMSDWGAVYNFFGSLNGGTDFEMPKTEWTPEAMKDALAKGWISEATLDLKVQHMLQTFSAFGLLDKPKPTNHKAAEKPELRAVAQQVAENGITLLKNDDNILPLKKGKFAVIGPNASMLPQGGGSGYIKYYSCVTPWKGMEKVFGKRANLIGAETYYSKVNDEGGNFYTDDKLTSKGFNGKYYGNMMLNGTPLIERVDVLPQIGAKGFQLPKGFLNKESSASWSTVYKATETGTVMFKLTGTGGYRMNIGEREICSDWGSLTAFDRVAEMKVEKDHTYKIEIQYRQNTGESEFCLDVVKPNYDNIKNALKSYETAVVCVGFDATTEYEGADRTFDLPGRQNELISQVASCVKNVIVVVNAGGGVHFTPWIDKVKGVIMAWYPGQEGGTALAEIIQGKVNPSGKLPMSMEREWADNPVYGNFLVPEEGPKVITYTEGLFYGYRGYDKRGQR
jgi:beta-glucosidase